MSNWQRTPEQKERDLALIADWTAQQYNSVEISQKLAKVTGYELAPRTVRRDIKQIRERWQEMQMDKYQMLVNQELARLDVLEREAWDAWRLTKSGEATSKTVEKMAREIEESIERGEDPDVFISRVTETVRSRDPDVKFLKAIHEIQQERRKLLGLYAPAQIGVNVNKRSEIRIKAYRTVSPDDWDSDDAHVAAAAMNAINEELALEAEIVDAERAD